MKDGREVKLTVILRTFSEARTGINAGGSRTTRTIHCHGGERR